MWGGLALGTLLLVHGACVAVVRTVRRRALGLDVALACALLVCAEALVVHGLSALHAVGRGGLLAGNLSAAGALWALARWRRGEGRRWAAPRPHPAHLAVAALGAMALVSALAYRPNNWDSMTYHLARVAHWLEQGSVAPFPTRDLRQVLGTPGAEYLLLALQGVAGSDRLGALVQWWSWLAVAAAAGPLARLLGAPRWLSPFAAVLAAAGPLAVQEASSTQNDLVAGVCAVAMVAAALPFLHRRDAWRSADLALLVVAITAGLLVKPTSAVVAAPFLLWGLAASWRAPLRRRGWARLGRATPVFLVAAGALLPCARCWDAEGRAAAAPYVYLGWAEGGDRARNVLRGIARNVPLPLEALDRLAPAQTEGCERPHSLCLEQNRRICEDSTASVGQALLVALCLLSGLLRRRRLPWRGRLALAGLAAAWCLFHLLFRDNVWVPRLHLPFFALSPVALAAFARVRPGIRRLVPAAGIAAVLVVVAGVAAVRTPRRPLLERPLRTAGQPASYYRGGPAQVAGQQQAVLDWLAASGCRSLGLHLGGDSYDYPITWRAMQLGVRVFHLASPGDHPCAVYSDLGPPPGAFRAVEGAGEPFLWVPVDGGG